MIRAAAGALVLILMVAAAVTVAREGRGGDEVGLLAAGPIEAPPPPADPFVEPGDPVPSSTAAPVAAAPAEPAAPTPEATMTVPSTVPTTTPPTTTVPPPVPLPADPNAVVLRVSYHSGYPLPGSVHRVQPIELHAGGRLVRPAPWSPTDPLPSHRRLQAFQVAVADVQAMVAAAEAGGATDPPADLGSNPMLADWGAQTFEVDRPGLRSRLIARDLEPRSTDAPNLTPDQRARRRVLLGLVDRLEQAGAFVGPVQSYVRAVAVPVPAGAGSTPTTAAADTRTWPGPALLVGPQSRCLVLPFAEMERRVPGWSSATSHTRWRSGEQVLRIDFYDATTPGNGCTPPP